MSSQAGTVSLPSTPDPFRAGGRHLQFACPDDLANPPFEEEQPANLPPPPAGTGTEALVRELLWRADLSEARQQRRGELVRQLAKRVDALEAGRPRASAGDEEEGVGGHGGRPAQDREGEEAVLGAGRRGVVDPNALGEEDGDEVEVKDRGEARVIIREDRLEAGRYPADSYSFMLLRGPLEGRFFWIGLFVWVLQVRCGPGAHSTVTCFHASIPNSNSHADWFLYRHAPEYFQQTIEDQRR